MKKNMNKKKTNKKEKELEDFIKRSMEKVISEIGLEKYYIQVGKSELESDKSKKSFLMINHSRLYKRVVIAYHPTVLEYWAYGKKDMIFQAITHEASHIITNNLADMAKDRFRTEREIDEAIEETTEEVARLIREVVKLKKIKIN